MHDGDSPEELARAFCRKEGLPAELEPVLAQEVARQWVALGRGVPAPLAGTAPDRPPGEGAEREGSEREGVERECAEREDAEREDAEREGADVEGWSASRSPGRSPARSPLRSKQSQVGSPPRSPVSAVHAAREASRQEYYAKLQERYARPGAAAARAKRAPPPWRSARAPVPAAEAVAASAATAAAAAAAADGANAAGTGKRKPLAKRVMSKKQVDEVCSRLYGQSLEARVRAERARMAERDALESDRLRECTFCPSISDHAKATAGGRVSGVGLQQQVQHYRDALVARDELHRERERQEVLSNCRSKPVISERSEQLLGGSEQRARKANLHEELFREAGERRARKAHVEDAPQYSFRPVVDHADPFFARLPHESEAGLIRRLAAPKQAQEVPLVDPETGQPLFTPVVGRPPVDTARSRPPGVPVAEYLFMARHQFEDVRTLLREEAEDRARTEREPLLSRASLKIAESIKETRFAQLWDALRDPQIDEIVAAEAQAEARAAADGGAASRATAGSERDQPAGEVARLRCLVELLPEVLVRHVGPDAVLAAAQSKGKHEFVRFMTHASRGLPVHTDILLA